MHYFSEPLFDASEVTGPVDLDLFANNSAAGMTFCALLVDVDPRGRAEVVLSGIASAMEASVGCSLELHLGHTCCVIAAGHRPGLILSSSSFPRWALPRSAESHEADNKVFHDTVRQSRLRLTVRGSRARGPQELENSATS